jgi:hypothetical protein
MWVPDEADELVSDSYQKKEVRTMAAKKKVKKAVKKAVKKVKKAAKKK